MSVCGQTKHELSEKRFFWLSEAKTELLPFGTRCQLKSPPCPLHFSVSLCVSLPPSPSLVAFLFLFLLFSPFTTMTVSYCVAGYRGAASPSAMLLDLWFPVKHNECYIRLFKVRWCTICSQAWKTQSNRDQQKALVLSEYSYSHSDKEADEPSSSMEGCSFLSSFLPNQSWCALVVVVVAAALFCF